jgi:hypothetical protein
LISTRYDHRIALPSSHQSISHFLSSSQSTPHTLLASVLKVAERAATGALAAAIAFSVNSPAAFAAAKKDALGIEVNSLPPISKDLKASVGIPGVKPVFGGAMVDLEAKVDLKKKGSGDIALKLPGDLKGAANGALKGHVAAVLKTPPLNVAVPVLGKISVPALNNERFDIDISTTAGRAVIEVKNDLIPAIPFPGKKKSDWQAVQNLGSGETYFYNTKTGVSQYEYPY